MSPLSHRPHGMKKINEDRKPVAGRIADKISLFEHPAGGVTKQSFQTPRSAGASPVRNAHQRLKASFEVLDQRSRPVDHHLKARSSSASPCRDRLMTIEEQAGPFMAVSEKRDAAALPPQSAMTGMSPQTPTYVTSGTTKSAGQDSQGRLDAKEQMQTNAKSEIALKPEGLDAVPAGEKISISVNESTGSTVDKTVASETADQSVIKEAGVAAKGPGEPEEMTNNISPQSKGPSRTASRSKRRKSKESTNSTTPHGENTTINQDQDTVFFFKGTEEQQGSSLDEQPDKNIKVLEKQEEHSSVIKENASRQEPEPSVNKDEPDMAACGTGSKTCVDEETGGNSVFVTQEEGEASKASREPPAPSSSLPAIKQKQEPPVQSRSDKVPLEEKRAGQVMELIKNDVENTQEPHKKVKLISHCKNEGADKSDTSNQPTEKTQNETPQQLSTPLDAVQSTSETRGGGAMDDDSKNTEEPQTIRDEQETKSDRLKLTAQKDGETEMTHSRGAEADRRMNETVGGTEGDRKLLEAEKRPPTESTERTGSTTAEKQAHSVLVAQTDNSPSDSCRHGANDVELPAEKPATEATPASEKVTLQVNHIALPLITAQAGDSSVKESALISASKSESKEGAGHTDEKNTSVIKSGPFEGKIAEEVIVPPGPLRKTDLLKGVGKMEPQPDDNDLTENSTPNELSPVANGDISQQPLPLTVKVEVGDDKPGQSPNLPASPEANKLISGSAQRSPKKKLNFSWGKSKEDSDRQQDAPSSWLDVDFPKQRLRVSAPKLNSSGSESNLLDTSAEFDEDDFVEKIKNLCAPFSLPPRKHNPLGPPQPPFALPAIKEDRFEKTFDPEEFKIGLRKPKYTLETASTFNKLHNMESKSGQKPFRASLSDRSILLSSLDTQSRLKTHINDEEEVTEEKDEKVKVKSRLEGSCVLSSLTSSLLKGKRNGVQTQAEGTNSEEVSPSNVPQSSSPPLCQPPPPSPSAARQSPGPSQREEAPALVNDSDPPLPSFTDIKLPDYLERYLPQEARKPAQDVLEQEQLQNKVSLF